MKGAAISLLFSLLFFHKTFSAELDTISDSLFLTDGDTLVSTTGAFELGFFRPGSSENRYLGIWYKNISERTVVWVANRDSPFVGASPHELKIADRGILVLSDNITTIWSSNTTTASPDATAKLRDDGNLVVMNERQQVLWQSFDYPTDTLLPGIKLGRDYVRGIEWRLSTWKSNQDPATGEYTWGADKNGYPENKLRQGSLIKFRDGLWKNERFSGISALFNKNITFRYDVVVNTSEVSFTYIMESNNIISRMSLNSSGLLQRWVWVEEDKKWQIAVNFPRDACDTYNICNGYGTCRVDTIQQTCKCLDEKRFVPQNPKDWNRAKGFGGCVRRTPLDCKNGTEDFIKYSNVKLPDAEDTWFNMSMALQECRVKCLQNCTCMAYANPDPGPGGRGCLLWFNELKDIRAYTNSDGLDIFVRIASSELDAGSISKKKGGSNVKIVLLVIVPAVFLIGFIVAWLWCARRKHNRAKPTGNGGFLNISKSEEQAMEQPLFSFSTIADATANFSPENKLGEGGFGSVYKGMLEEGQEIAVKRLSKYSSQGHDEFKNEVICISKHQHRNLVKLLGCCIQGDEKLLIYECMPNKSLDYFIFDKTKLMLLDWTKRFNIIKGIARGLVYLHQDSRLRIIHRDLKASNILLDQDMNPKISDFGIARSFGGNETQANTERVVGTYGYMSPEYALDGVFSIKSDVFSFGVLVLEIASGSRSGGFIQSGNANNLIGHAWSLYSEDRSIDLIDASLVESCHLDEVLRSIKVGLLCVQQNAGDRPNMSFVIMMLGGDSPLPEPKQPAFFMENDFHQAHFSSGAYKEGSVNEVTITQLGAR